MGIAGAGLSTAISQYISFAILMIMYYKGDAQSKPHIKYITLKPRFVATIITTGLPSLARQGLNSVSNMVLNIEAALYGDACIAAMSIVAKCANLIFSVCVGTGRAFSLCRPLITAQKNIPELNPESNSLGAFPRECLPLLRPHALPLRRR